MASARLETFRFHMPRFSRLAPVLLGALLVAAIEPAAQSQPAPSPAAQAFREGQYEQVERLLQSATDPASLALRARALVALGRYDDAEKMLARPAGSAPTSDAALELGLVQMEFGRRADARRTLNALADGLQRRLTSPSQKPTAAEYLRFGRASGALAEMSPTAAERTAMSEDAKTAFTEAGKLSPRDPEIEIAFAQTLLSANNLADAAAAFQAALKIDQSHPAALVGFGTVARDRNPPAAREAVAQALKVNPRYEPAHLLSADMALDDRRRADARESIDVALKVNPNSVAARTMLVTIAFLEGRQPDYDRGVQEILALRPTYGEVYRVVGDHAARNYRFDEAAELVRQALKVDPENTRAYADLGMHLLRTGDEAGARQTLEQAFARNAYDEVTFNLLDLLDRLDKFEVVQAGNIIMKFEPGEAAVMREQAVPFARQALDALSKRWNVDIKGPILIEMFPKHDDFAVRNLGLPGMIGALGACFGRVVTLDSPKARPPGDYNWQPTLWHELAHVVTLHLSNNRVPRWLTEGISVWEERRARPEWGREMEVSFARAMDQGKAIKLSVLNEGFSDPTMISLAYHQASLVVEHLAAVYGEPSLGRLLQAYGRGLETDAAIKEVYGTTLDEIQKTFDAKLERDYRALITALKPPTVKAPPSVDELKKLAAENPNSFPVQMSLGRALDEAGDAAGAIAAFEKAAALVPSATGDDNPNKEIARIALAQKNTERAMTALEAVLKVDHADVEAARTLIPLVADGPPARAASAYQRLVDVDPFEAPAHAALGKFAMQQKDAQGAVKAYRTALALNPPDRASALVDLGEAYLLARQPAEAKTQALAALEMAPAFERAHELLLNVVDGEQ